MKRSADVWKPTSRFVKRRGRRFEIVTRSLELLSYLAQIGAVVLAWYGYVHTVLPVFQKEKLDEDLARLQIEQEKVVSELGRLRSLQRSADARLEASNLAAKDARLRADQAAIERDAEIRKADGLRRQNAEYESAIRDAKASILNLQWQQFVERVGLQISFILSRDFNYYEMMPYVRGAPKEPPDWPDAFSIAMKAVDEVAKEFPSENRDVLVSNAKAYISQRSGEISCPAPPGFVKHVITEPDKKLSDAAFACEKHLAEFAGKVMELKLADMKP